MSAESVKNESASSAKMCLACSQEFQGDMNVCPVDGTSLIALNKGDPFLGKVVADRYEVTEIIGKGGMGVVYRARHQMMDRIVALKMLQAELTQDEMSVKRFQQEAKAASHLSHPHLITLHDFGVLSPSNQPYLVMEYLEGWSLLDVLRADGPLEPKRAVKIFSEVADGLYHAHKVGILHRDLKPSNILLIEHNGDPDFAKIVDFGLAKLMPWSGKESQHLTKTGEVFGSPIYMSPEQCMGKPLDVTSDIYSLGITLFEVLTGKPPFRGSNSIQTASKHMSEPPPRFTDINPNIALPEGLQRVVTKCLAKNPAERFQDMAEFKDALQAGLNSERVEMPASLMVSTRAIPAIQAQNQLPASVVRAQRPQPEREGPAIPKWAIPAAAGVLLLGGVSFAFLPVGENTTGTVTFYDPVVTNELHIHDAKGNHVLKLGDKQLGRNNADDSVIGQTATASYNHPRFGGSTDGTLNSVSLKKEQDDVPKAAMTALNDFLNAVADRWAAKVEEFNPEIAKKFLTENPGPYRYETGRTGGGINIHGPDEPTNGQASNAGPKPGDEPYRSAFRGDNAYKLLDFGSDRYQYVVNGSEFVVSKAPVYWKFVLVNKNGKWDIESYNTVPESEWNKI